MPLRVKVNINWDEATQTFHPFDSITNKKLTNFNNLDYGDIDTRIDNAIKSDDKTEVEKMFKNDGTLDKAAKLKGWCTVP